MFLIVAILFSTSGCSNVSDDNVYQGEMKTEALKKLKNDLLVLNSNYMKTTLNCKQGLNLNYGLEFLRL